MTTLFSSGLISNFSSTSVVNMTTLYKSYIFFLIYLSVTIKINIINIFLRFIRKIELLYIYGSFDK